MHTGLYIAILLFSAVIKLLLYMHVFADLPDFQVAMRAATLDTATGIHIHLISSVVGTMLSIQQCDFYYNIQCKPVPGMSGYFVE